MKLISYDPDDFVPFTREMVADISLALLNIGVPNECQQCHKGKTQIVPAASMTILQNRAPDVNMIIGKPIVCAMTICDFCGHKEEYDLERLGLMDKFAPFFQEQLKKDMDRPENQGN